jgi:E3 ubiquitin-protein ligase HECTD2
MGHKELMVGDVYDVATSLVVAGQSSPSRRPASSGDPWTPKLVSAGSPHIDWKYVQKWYEIILHMSIRHDETGESPKKEEPDSRASQALEDLGYAIRGSVLDMMEHLLLTPQQAPSEPQDVRYLLMLLANPLLMSPKENPTRGRRQRSSTLPASQSASKQNPPPQNVPKASWNASKQSRVLSLLLGVLSNASAECHSQMIQWLSRYPEDIFRKQVDMLLAFVNERISLRNLGHKSSRKNARPGYNGFQPTQIFDDILQSDVVPKDLNGDDWQLRSACKVLQLFVRANDIYHGKPLTARPTPASVTTRRRPVVKQLMPTDHFYNAQLDSEDTFNPRRDFDEWEKKEPGLQLSAYPFLLTLSAKMQILEFDAKRKMASKVRQEFFDSIARNTNLEKYFHLKVRRRCMVEDSLTRISEAISSSEGEAKKALKVQFDGEEGIDAGGLRKEWFLLLVRELLDPDVGLFLYNEETNYCYFNPLSLESSEQYQLVGAVLGLAIYNFTILDVPFPPFLFRKLAAAAPPSMLAANALERPAWRPELADLAQLDPTLARSLQHVLDYAGNVGEDIGAVFRVDTLQYGRVRQHPLVAGGGERAVTRKTRDEYVDLYVEYVLDKSVRRHFEPFARGFFSVCGGAALALFRGEEIEMLIRGSGDVDFAELRGRAVYEGWRDPSAAEEGGEGPELTGGADVEAAFPVVRWFWELMALSGAADQRRVLRWITGSDRVPTAGVGAGLELRIQCLGGDCERLPQARTCFNVLQLWNYATRRCFVRKFWYAVVESEGFGLK